MRVLILGSGAREHAVTWNFSRSRRISGLFIAPGNAGTGELGTNLPEVDPESAEQVVEACKQHHITMVFVGPEGPLADGIVDALEAAGIPAIGPHKAAARLEASKCFSKNFMLKHGIPTAEAREFSDTAAFEKYIQSVSGKWVVKKSGLAAGKGVLESDNMAELMEFGAEILKDDSLLVEEFLEGMEISLFALTDGNTYRVLPPCADYKKAGEDDTGRNTGGMGAICPVPSLSRQMMEEIDQTIVAPTFSGLKQDGLSFRGVLFFGLMLTAKGPRLLEYNVRFGDPETQVLLPLISSDFGNLCEALLEGTLESFPLSISSQSALGVVVASPGYPGDYPKGLPVKPIPSFPESDVLVYHASTRVNGSNQTVTGGGRCFTVTGLGQDLLKASIRAYEAVNRVSFEGAWYRKDIGKKFYYQ